MHRRAVVALRVVLDDQLPVGGDVVNLMMHADQGAQVVRRHALVQRQKLRRHGLGIPGEIDEDEAVPDLRRHREQRPLRFVESGQVVRRRRALQAPVEAVSPTVVRALDRLGEPAFASLAEPRAAVAADVVERAHGPIAVPDHDDARLAGRDEEVVPGLRDPALAAGAQPVAGEQLLDLFGEDRRAGGVRAWQGTRALEGNLGTLDEGRHRGLGQNLASRPGLWEP